MPVKKEDLYATFVILLKKEMRLLKYQKLKVTTPCTPKEQKALRLRRSKAMGRRILKRLGTTPKELSAAVRAVSHQRLDVQ